jgi:DNA invertase Pin-like site-specific DNA recombinase
MKVALYARVSTHDKGQDPETQLHKLRQFAESKGYQVIGEWADQASGADPNRPKLVEMLDKSRSYDAIIITKLDRMMRSTKNLLNMLEDFDKKRIALICVDQPIETNTAMGRFLIQILSAVAEFERELTRDRVNDGLARARANGKKLGRPEVPLAKASRTTRYRRSKKEGANSLYNNEPKNANTENR